MEKKSRRRKGERGVHTAVVLPREMLELLRESGRARGMGVSEEIRDRLAKSLFDDALDQTTRYFTGEIFELAKKVRRYFGGEWYADANAHAALVAAVEDQLASHKPAATSAAATPGTTTPLADPPAVVGRVIAREYRHEKQEIEASRTAYRNRPRSSKEQEND
jgi:hypothetical protein